MSLPGINKALISNGIRITTTKDPPEKTADKARRINTNTNNESLKKYIALIAEILCYQHSLVVKILKHTLDLADR